MTTPTTQSHPTEPEAARAGSPTGAPSPDPVAASSDARKSGATENAWINFAMFSIGAVAVIGFLVIMFGIYVLEPDSVAMILIGMGILLIATIAWLVAAWVMLGGFILGLFTSRGKKSRKSRLQQG